MKTTSFFIGLLVILGMVTDCLPENNPHPNIVMGITDLQCDDVWEGVLRILKTQKIPLLVVDKKAEYIETGSVLTIPLEGDLFQKMEEQYGIEIKCKEPLVTQITCQIKVRGLTNDNNWIVVKDVLKYEMRFLDNLKFNLLHFSH